MTIPQIICFLTKSVTQLNNLTFILLWSLFYLCTINIETFKMHPASVLNSFVHPIRDCCAVFQPLRCVCCQI